MTRNYIQAEKKGATVEELEKFTLGSLRKAVYDGDTKTGSLMSGQTCGQLTSIRPVKEILSDLFEC
jgi:enoyl-[acyl-carrier protein] reductase II